jgi:hypothetical protein
MTHWKSSYCSSAAFFHSGAGDGPMMGHFLRRECGGIQDGPAMGLSSGDGNDP